MKRIAALLFALLLTWNSRADFSPTNEIGVTLNISSYSAAQFTSPSYVYWFADMASHLDCMFPQWTNRIYNAGASGSTWQNDYQANEEMIYVPLWNSFTCPGWDWILPNDNGGYSSNSVIQWGTNFFSYPPLSWNGTASTNEGLSSPGLSHWSLGGIPDATAPPTSLSWLRYTASTNLNALYGAPNIGLHEILRTNGYTTNALFVYAAGGHPQAAGSLIAADEIFAEIHLTNQVGSILFNYLAATVSSSNYFAAAGISVANNILTVSALHAVRMAGWFDIQDGVNTNAARGAFQIVTNMGGVVNSNLANVAQWIIQATNLPSYSNFVVSFDGRFAAMISSNTLAAGWNMYTNYQGSFANQRKAVFNAVLDQMGVDHVTRVAHSAGSFGTIAGIGDMVNFGGFASQSYVNNHNRGVAHAAAMASHISDLRQYDVKIWQAAQQTNHTLTIQPFIPTAIVSVSSVTNAYRVPVILDGSASIDAVNYFWTQTNGAQCDMIGFGTSKPMLISVTNAGTFGFQLVVSDGVVYSTNGVLVTFVAPTGRTNYIDFTLSANATSGNYSIASRNGSGSDGNGYKDFASAVAASLPGDLFRIRGGFLTNAVTTAGQNFLNITNSGTVTKPIRFENYNGELVQLVGWGFSDATNGSGLEIGPNNSLFRQTLVFIQPGANYIQVSGLDLTNCQQSAFTIEGNFCYVQECQAHDNWLTGFGISRVKASGVTVQGDVIRWCDAHYNRHFTGMLMGLEDELTFAFMSDCAFVDCLSYGNGHLPNGTRVQPAQGDTQGGGNSGGFWSTKYFADNAFNYPQYGVLNWGTNLYYVRSIAWSNCDDGFAFDHSQSLIEDNRSAFNGPTGGQGYKILRATQGLTFRSDVAYSNQLRGFDLRLDANTYIALYNLTSLLNANQGVIIAGTDGTSLIRAINNLAGWNGNSDWSTPQSTNWGVDGNNVGVTYRGNPILTATNISLPTTGLTGATIRARRDNIEAIFNTALTPATNSPLLRAGAFVTGYFCPFADDDPINPMLSTALGKHWGTNAPDIGAFSVLNTSIMLPSPPQNTPARYGIYR